MIEKYSESVSQLFLIGMPDSQLFKPVDYVQQYRLMAEHLPELLVLMKEISLYEQEEPEYYAPIHAYRAAVQFMGPSILPLLFDILADPELIENDFLHEDIENIFVAFGPDVLPDLNKGLQQYKNNSLVYSPIAIAIGQIGRDYPQVRQEVIQLLVENLQQYDKQNRVLNAYLVGSLLDLKAVEAEPYIRAAYAANKVEERMVGDMKDAEIVLGLVTPQAIPRLLSQVSWAKAKPKKKK